MKVVTRRKTGRRGFLHAAILWTLLGVSALLWLAAGASAQNMLASFLHFPNS
jgi:hypothetical protein